MGILSFLKKVGISLYKKIQNGNYNTINKRKKKYLSSPF